MEQESPIESKDSDQPANKKMKPSPSQQGASTTTTNTSSPKGTLYITVGPQCSGKTTILRNIFGRTFHKNEEDIISVPVTTKEEMEAGVDITVDDQTLVYIPVPTSYFLQSTTSNTVKGTEPATFPSLNQTIFGKTVRERIRDASNEELRLVIQRLSGTLAADSFATRIRGNTTNINAGIAAVQRDLIDATEQTISTKGGGGDLLPETIDLFVVESIFRPRPKDLMKRISNEHTHHHHNTSNSSEPISGLDQALHLLKAHANDSTAPMSWGNTNTRPREFQSALDAAASSGRPVEFIVFGGMEACDMIREHVSRREYRKMSHDIDESIVGAVTSDDAAADAQTTVDNNSLLCLPKVDRKTLFLRNLNRFLQTGRYIPSTAICDAIVRVESLLANAAAEANKEYPRGGTESEVSKIDLTSAKFRLDYELAKLAGYRLNSNRIVSCIDARRQDNRRGNNNHQPRRNNYQSGRGGGRYNGRGQRSGGRGRSNNVERGYNYRGRGGRSGNQQHQNARSYNNSERGYNQGRSGESNRQRYDGYDSRAGRGNDYNWNHGHRFEPSNDDVRHRHRSSGDSCDAQHRSGRGRRGRGS